MENDSLPTTQSNRKDTLAALGIEDNKYYVIAETLSRITFAGFGGSLYGLTLEKQQLAKDRQSSVALATLSKPPTKEIGPGRRMYPPVVSPQSKRYQRQSYSLTSIQSGGSNIPMTWAISCMIFVSLLESCRITSPTSKILISLNNVPLLGIGEKYSLFEGGLYSKQRRVAFVAIGDYTVGGTLAGIAGAYARRGNPTQSFPGISHPVLQAGSRPLLFWGIGAGMGFGIVAGTFQALSDVFSVYLQSR